MRMVKIVLAALIIIGMVLPALARDVFVRGYFRRNGTYVQPHRRTVPDRNPYNNYTTRGNTNPYTGKKGYVRPPLLQSRPLLIAPPPAPRKKRW